MNSFLDPAVWVLSIRVVSKKQGRFIGDYSFTLERYAVISTFRNITNLPPAALLVYSEVSRDFSLSFNDFFKYWQMCFQFGSFGYSDETMN